MRFPSIGAEVLLNAMRTQIAQVHNSPQQVQQIEAQTSRKLETLDLGVSKGTQVNLSA